MNAIESRLRAGVGIARRRVRQTRNRLARTSAILLYHRVAEGFDDPWSLCVTPAHFAEHLAVLAARRVASLDALVENLARDRHERLVAVTFDDGYADFHDTALPALAARGVPATLFVATSGLRGDVEFWWDELERIVLAPPHLPSTLHVEIGGQPFAWTDAGDRRALYLALHRRLGRCEAATRGDVLVALRRWAGVPAGVRETHRPIGRDALATVARADGVRVGAHTVSHPYLGALDGDEQIREIAASKAELEVVTGRPVEHFSYPHGDRTAATVATVRSAGFRVACASEEAPVRAGADPLALPRVEVPDLDGRAFARWLDELVG
jgi:peptidoglycan/xylan/chitin deacetylase (PgdA/CDA1 family)